MPDEAADIAGLERQRAGLYEELSQVGDFRRGSLNEVWRRRGKANCGCAQPGHPGHGPQYNLTRSAGGKTVARHLKPGRNWKRSGGRSPNTSGSGRWWGR